MKKGAWKPAYGGIGEQEDDKGKEEMGTGEPWERLFDLIRHLIQLNN